MATNNKTLDRILSLGFEKEVIDTLCNNSQNETVVSLATITDDTRAKEKLIYWVNSHKNGKHVCYKFNYSYPDNMNTKELSHNNIFLNGIPRLGAQMCSSRVAIENLEHEEANFEERPFSSLKKSKEEIITSPSRIWTDLGCNDSLSWATESDIQGYVKLVIKDAITAVGLEKELSCFNALGVFRLCSDTWIVYERNEIPVGVVVIKKPGSKIMNSSQLHGKMYDYMLRLRHYFGQQWVFGIASTYEEWRIYWLSDCDQIAAYDSVEKFDTKPDIEKPSQVPHLIQQATQLDDDVSQTPIKRKVNGTNIVRWDDPNLPMLLISVIQKMHQSPKARVTLVDSKRSYIQLTTNSWFWNGLPSSGTLTLDYGTLPAKNIKNLFLLHDLRGGAHGRVWLACSASGKVCVLKFPKHKTEAGQKTLEKEAKIWNEVWNLPVSIGTWCGEPALMMPFVLPCPEGRWSDSNAITAVKQAVTHLAQHGHLKHNDLKWEHVGLYQDKEGLKVVLFDLADMCEITDSSEEAIISMMEDLSLK